MHCSKQQDDMAGKAVTDPGLLHRTSWTNASVALMHIKKVSSDTEIPSCSLYAPAPPPSYLPLLRWIET